MAYVDYGFYFEEAGRAGYQGPNDPSGEYFTNRDLEESLAREIIQNSMDARVDSSGTVTVEFELRNMPTDEIPDIEGLRVATQHALVASQDLQGTKYLDEAHKSTNRATVPVLRIGDYGTLGLVGSESKDRPHTPLSTLTRSTGASSNDGDRGGSFGIGSAVGPLASRMRTVAYVSKRIDDPDVVYAAFSKLASFKDSGSEWRQGSGYFTRLSYTQDFQYLRNPSALGDFAKRTEDGTDLYIFDYREAEKSSGLDAVKRAAVENFFVAIHRGRLIVKGRTAESDWILDSASLADAINADTYLAKNTRPFFRALTESASITKDLKHTGTCQLFVHVDEELDRKLGTQVMRKPLMKVDTLAHAIHVPYAAVFICEDEIGNKLLRDIEPPTHDKWNHQGPRSNKPAVDEIKRFIREELQRVIPEKLGQSVKIKGLAKFLPVNLGASPNGVGGAGSASSNLKGNENESPVRLGRPERYDPLDWRTQKPVSIPVVRQGTPGGEDEGASGGAPSNEKRTRGGGTGGSQDGGGQGGNGNNAAPSSTGEGNNRISKRSVNFRSFADAVDGFSVMVLTAMEDVTGDLSLIAMGSGNREDYAVSIESASMLVEDDAKPLTVSGAAIKGMALKQGETVRIRMRLGNGAQYRLGIKNG